MPLTTPRKALGGSDIALRPGTFTGYNGYCTNRDRGFWGPDADEFRPERWGATAEEAAALYRRATSKAALITFHGGKRACLGQKWALAAHRLTMSTLREYVFCKGHSLYVMVQRMVLSTAQGIYFPK